MRNKYQARKTLSLKRTSRIDTFYRMRTEEDDGARKKDLITSDCMVCVHLVPEAE